MSKMGPNFEMALYVAQATGSSIMTDSPYRWQEIQMAIRRQGGETPHHLPQFQSALSGETFRFPNAIDEYASMHETEAFRGYAPPFGNIFNYLVKRADKASETKLGKPATAETAPPPTSRTEAHEATRPRVC